MGLQSINSMMTITSAAAEFIRTCLSRSNVPNPVVCLVEFSDTPKDVAEAVQREPHRKEVLEMALKVHEAGPRYMHPAIYTRSHFLWLSTTIQGFRFAPLFFHPPHARRAMKRGLLNIAERGLVLSDSDGTAVLPRPATGAL